ncbi:serine/threonine-protein kinase S6KL isoform X2 [Battus philenor]|uniref:serine/threonine-protein kinase S6KL isoform X2 n=1 Tax=Battus philenor TaxID=42288 RepID=UPI0035CF303D
MGNSHNKSIHYRDHKHAAFPIRDGQAFTSQFSLSHFGNLSGRSFISLTSNQSVCSASRPWSRVSRRRWNDSTLNNHLEASKTAWPVTHKESIFLPEFPITTHLNKDFQVISAIAKGAFGEVLKVRKNSNGKEYALKVLSKSQVVAERAVNQVKAEASIQSACGHHSFIVGAVSRWQTKKTLYIVTEYVSGGELLALLERYRKLPEEIVKVFVAEIAIALDFLHNAGVIYRDLKPENILIDEEFHLKLIDFGLSKWLSIGARTTTICGTLKYMAPEILSREPYGHAADWWSLGVITCRMFTDEYPAPAITENPAASNEVEIARTSNDVIANDIADNGPGDGSRIYTRPLPGTLPETAQHLSKASRALLLRLLERDPKVRMRSLRQLQQSALYMGFNFEHVKTKKVSPRSLFKRYFLNDDYQVDNASKTTSQDFASFDEPIKDLM